ncbi:MAG: PDZ domain-containing protein, partial [Clostridia bacterium]|nr:PDZ domain-containing protein [Clostridia bacterium]
MKKFRIFIKTATVFFLVLSVGIFTVIGFLQKNISENYKIQKGETLKLGGILPITAEYKGSKESISSTHQVGDTFDVDLKLFGVIPFSSTTVEVVDEMYVAVLGNPFGMKIYTDGVLVIELSSVLSDGKTKNPAKKSGLEVGDYIKKANGCCITTNEDLSEVVMNSAGAQIDLEVLRGNQTLNLKLTPVKSDEDGLFHAGIWVRDSSAGI